MGNKVNWDEVIHRAESLEGTVEHLEGRVKALGVSLESSNKENQELRSQNATLIKRADDAQERLTRVDQVLKDAGHLILKMMEGRLGTVEQFAPKAPEHKALIDKIDPKPHSFQRLEIPLGRQRQSVINDTAFKGVEQEIEELLNSGPAPHSP